MPNFKPKLATPGDVIHAEDWNSIQEGLLSEIEQLEAKYQELRSYVDSMTETNILTNVESLIGRPYGLDELVPGEKESYGTVIMGLITKQWLPRVKGVVDICRFVVTSKFLEVSYWAGATNGNKKSLAITIRYVDGTTESVDGVYVHDRDTLSQKGEDNPFVEYLISPNQKAWYRYRLVNPKPDKEALSVTFKNSDAGSTVRIGNVMHVQTKISPRKAN